MPGAMLTFVVLLTFILALLPKAESRGGGNVLLDGSYE